jgi:hypothetical protein
MMHETFFLNLETYGFLFEEIEPLANENVTLRKNETIE